MWKFPCFFFHVDSRMPAMTFWLPIIPGRHGIENRFWVKCEVYFSSACWTLCQRLPTAPQQIDQEMFLVVWFFPRVGRSTPGYCQLWCFWKLWHVAAGMLQLLIGPQTGLKRRTKATKPAKVEKDPTFLVNRLSRRGNHFFAPQKTLSLRFWEQFFT